MAVTVFSESKIPKAVEAEALAGKVSEGFVEDGSQNVGGGVEFISKGNHQKEVSLPSFLLTSSILIILQSLLG